MKWKMVWHAFQANETSVVNLTVRETEPTVWKWIAVHTLGGYAGDRKREGTTYTRRGAMRAAAMAAKELLQ